MAEVDRTLPPNPTSCQRRLASMALSTHANLANTYSDWECPEDLRTRRKTWMPAYAGMTVLSRGGGWPLIVTVPA